MLPCCVNSPPGTLAGLGRFLKMMVNDPRDVGPALIFGRRMFTNMGVFQKKVDAPPEATDLAWEYYRSF